MGPTTEKAKSRRGHRRLLAFLAPPPTWRLPVAIALGVFVGLGLLTLHASRATSYLADTPEGCINCHIMQPEYAAWERTA